MTESSSHTTPQDSGWVDVCLLDDLEINWGEAALIDGHEYAVFRTVDDAVFLTDHTDPNSGALVMARGIVGLQGGKHTVASPLYKETYDLATGECLSGAEFVLPVYPTRVENGRVQARTVAEKGR